MNSSSTIFPGNRTAPVRGAYNVDRLLDLWFKFVSSGNGCDINVLGDSNTEGYVTSRYEMDNWFSMLAWKVQEKFQGKDVVGGKGSYYPVKALLGMFSDSGGVAANAIISARGMKAPSETKGTDWYGSVKGTFSTMNTNCNLYYANQMLTSLLPTAVARTDCFISRFPGTHRHNTVTDITVCYESYIDNTSNGGDVTYPPSGTLCTDVSFGAPLAGTATGAITSSLGTTAKKRSSLSTISFNNIPATAGATNDVFFQIAGGSQFGSGTREVAVSKLMLFNRDLGKAGWRWHNGAGHGRTLFNQIKMVDKWAIADRNGTTVTRANLIQSVGIHCTTNDAAVLAKHGTNGASYCGFIFIKSGLNELNIGSTTPTRTVEEYRNDQLEVTGYTNGVSNLKTNILASPDFKSDATGGSLGASSFDPAKWSDPLFGVISQLPPNESFTGLWNRTSNHINDYVAVSEKETALANGHFYFDFFEYLYGTNVRQSYHNQELINAGICSSDGIHLSSRGHRLLADVLFGLICDAWDDRKLP